jgi:Sigma-70 region 2
VSGHNDVASVIASALPMVLPDPDPARPRAFVRPATVSNDRFDGYRVVMEPLVPRHGLAVQAERHTVHVAPGEQGDAKIAVLPGTELNIAGEGGGAYCVLPPGRPAWMSMPIVYGHRALSWQGRLLVRALHATGLDRLLDVAVAAPGEDLRHGQRDMPGPGEKHRGELRVVASPMPVDGTEQDEYTHLIPLQRYYARLSPDHPERQRIRQVLISGYHPVAAHIAGRFGGRGEPLDDLIQVATVGLINTVDRYEPGRGSHFWPSRCRPSPVSYGDTFVTIVGRPGCRADSKILTSASRASWISCLSNWAAHHDPARSPTGWQYQPQRSSRRYTPQKRTEAHRWTTCSTAGGPHRPMAQTSVSSMPS